jgi:hypothetical protein
MTFPKNIPTTAIKNAKRNFRKVLKGLMAVRLSAVEARILLQPVVITNKKMGIRQIRAINAELFAVRLWVDAIGFLNLFI